MGFFNKSKTFHIPSPLQGTTIPITQVPDPTFANKILGEGIAVIPTGGKVYAPCNATVDLMFQTAHAVNLICSNGVELLIHVGINTVELKGKHFTPHVKTGDTVKQGDLLITFEKDAIEQEGYSVLVPIVVCGTAGFSHITGVTDKQVSVGDTIFILST